MVHERRLGRDALVVGERDALVGQVDLGRKHAVLRKDLVEHLRVVGFAAEGLDVELDLFHLVLSLAPTRYSIDVPNRTPATGGVRTRASAGARAGGGLG